MAFRSSEYLQRNELVRFQLDDVIRAPTNNQHQEKKGYKFAINDRSSFFDWFNGFFEVRFQLQKLADGTAYNAERITMINGSHTLIKHLMIKSAGKIVYDTDNLHNVTFVKNVLEYSNDLSRRVAKNSFWYLDTTNTTAVGNTGYEASRLLTRSSTADRNGPPSYVNIIIPINRYSFFEELEDKMLVPMQLQFKITLSSLSNCRLEYGQGTFYPEREYESNSKVRICNDLLSYAMRKNDYDSGSQLNLSNYDSL